MDVTFSVARPATAEEREAEGDPGLLWLPHRECGAWSYPDLLRFRRRLAWVEGFDLLTMQGYETPWHPFPACEPWDSVDTALAPFLNSPDDEGEYTPAECGRMWGRLTAICLAFPVFDRDQDQGLKLANGMHECFDSGVPMIYR